MLGGKQKKIFFENGYGISFVGGDAGLYGDGVKTWEAAEFAHNAWYKLDLKTPNDRVNLDVDFDIIYDHTEGDVLGYLTVDECDELIKKIRNLAPRDGMNIIEETNVEPEKEEDNMNKTEIEDSISKLKDTIAKAQSEIAKLEEELKTADDKIQVGHYYKAKFYNQTIYYRIHSIDNNTSGINYALADTITFSKFRSDDVLKSVTMEYSAGTRVVVQTLVDRAEEIRAIDFTSKLVELNNIITYDC